MIFSRPLYYILSVKDHKHNKENILSKISQDKNSSFCKNLDITDDYSIISNTDYNNQGFSSWFSEAFSLRDQLNYKEFISKKYGKKNLEIIASWFNQYYKMSGSEHPFHNHAGEEFSVDLVSVYYVELEDKSLRTILKHPRTGKEIVPRVKEGQILTFDSRVDHRSPRNYTDTRKTIISFNVQLLAQ